MVQYFGRSPDGTSGHLTEAGWELMDQLESWLGEGFTVEQVAACWTCTPEQLHFLRMVAQLTRQQFEAEIRGL